MADPVLTARDLNRATLARQMLLAREAAKPLAVLERLAGLQAQWPKPPHVGLWSRIEGFERGHLLALLRSRKAVRASMMRGTLHVVSAKDYALFRRTLQPMLTRGVHAVLRGRMTGIVVDDVTEHAREVLDEGPKTFDVLRDALAARNPKADVRAMGFVARLYLPLVQVPTEDDPWGYPASSAFALGSAWIGRELDEAPLDVFIQRYLSAFGPAAASDFQTWSGIQGAKDAFEALRPKLAAFRDERKREVFDLPRAPRPGGDAAAPVRFLPEFDNLVLAHTDRRRFVADVHRKQVFLPGLRVAPTLLVDGFVAGTWGIARKKTAATLTITPFEALAKKAQRDLGDEAERLVRFVEPDATAFDVRFAASR